MDGYRTRPAGGAGEVCPTGQSGKTAGAGAELCLQSLETVETVCSLDHLPKQQQGVVHGDPRNPRDLSSLSDSDTSHAPTQSAQQGVWIRGNDANPKGMRCCS